MNKTSLASLVATLFVGLTAHAQNLLLNGSFESPAISANSVLQTTPDTWLGQNLPNIINGDYSPGIPLPQDGQQFASLGHYPSESQAASLSQMFTISSPGNYELNWYDSSEFNGPNASAPYSVTVTDGLASIVVSETFDSNATALRLWTQRSISLALLPDTYKLSFISHQSPSSEGTAIDNVSLAVPEPSTFLLLAIALFGFLVRIRRV